MMTKRNLLITSGIATAAMIFLIFTLGVDRLCGGAQHTACTQRIDSLFETFLIILPLFLMSCIAYFLHEDTFRAWLKFAYLFIPLLMIGIFVSPEYGSAILPITKGSVAMIGSLFFVVVSIGIMLFKSASSKK